MEWLGRQSSPFGKLTISSPIRPSRPFFEHSTILTSLDWSCASKFAIALSRLFSLMRLTYRCATTQPVTAQPMLAPTIRRCVWSFELHHASLCSVQSCESTKLCDVVSYAAS